MSNTKITFLKPEYIDQRAAEAVRLYGASYGTQLPINPEKLLEIEYDMQIIPLPGIKDIGIECAFSQGGSTILVDQADFDNPAKSTRLAFTFAHELGHKILHPQYLGTVNQLSDAQVAKLEQQARMFAARFLMPEPILLGVIASEISERLDSIVGHELTLEVCIEWRITNLASYFGVSEEAMKFRIMNIKLDKILSGPYISASDKERLIELASAVERLGSTRWGIQPNKVLPAVESGDTL